MKTKDNYEVRVDMWLSNHDGIYCVTSIQSDCIYAKEVIFEDDSTDKHHFGNELRFTKEELKHLEYL